MALILPPFNATDRDIALSSPAGLAYVHSRGKIISPPHITLLNMKVLDMAGGRLKFLLVSMPPRHGKSEFLSKAVPAWWLGTFPDNRVILSSYEADFASKFGAAARDMLTDTAHIFGTGPVGGRLAAAASWQTPQKGGMETAGVGGAITGKGMNLGIADDLIKNAMDAQSATMRNRAIEWLKTTFLTRREPGAAVIIVMTRWHEDDTIGFIEREYKHENYEVVRLPALAEAGDPLGRPEGAALWPARYNETTLQSTKLTLGPYWFNAMYQQRPSPAKGSIFQLDWFKYVDEFPEAQNIFALWWSWDCAVKTGEENDYSVGQLWAITNMGFVLLRVVRGRWEYPELKRMVVECALNTNINGKATTALLVEDKSSGQQIIQELKAGIIRGREALGQGEVRHIPVIAFDKNLVSKDKVLRARLASPNVYAGKVYVLRAQPWGTDFFAEVMAFPNAPHDDQVDTMTQFLLHHSPKFAGKPASGLSGNKAPDVDW